MQHSPRHRPDGSPPFLPTTAPVASIDARPPPQALLRLPEVLRRIPVSRSTWWEGVRTGRYPPPLKISPRCSAWSEAEIQALISRLKAGKTSADPH